MPIRIQRKRTKGWKMPDNTIYVGRPTKWGNPFKVGKPYRFLTNEGIVKDNTHAVELFNLYRISSHKSVGFILEIAKALKGKNLACWCPLVDKNGCYVQCHADILLKLANS